MIGRVFQGWMTAQTELQVPLILDAYDFSRFNRVADLGGGRGIFLGAVLRAYPGLRAVLFDLPEIVSRAASLCDSHARAGRARRGRCPPIEDGSERVFTTRTPRT